MKKSLIFVGMLAIGFANAQEYDGKVGINTSEPSATLNVKSKTRNTSGTKNLELENADSKKLVTVLDNGFVGVNNETPTSHLHVKGYALVENGDLRVVNTSPEGPHVTFDNPLKDKGFRWKIFNMLPATGVTHSQYIPGLHFISYDKQGNQTSNLIKFTDTGRLSVGQNNVDVPLETIHAEGSIIANNGILRTRRAGDLGGSISIENLDKIENEQAYQWRIYNMKGAYGNSLRFFAYNKDTEILNNNSSVLVLTDSGNVGIGGATPTEKLEVDGKIKASSLAQTGAGDRVVYADENGVLKTGVSAAANVKLATANNVECTETNTGTMNFGSVTINGKATEAFGFCMKNSTGEYKWYYIYGGTGITTGSGVFGSNL